VTQSEASDKAEVLERPAKGYNPQPAMNDSRARWWGRFSLEIDERAMWQVGPTRLTALRRAREWCIDYVEEHENRDDASFEHPSARILSAPSVARHRFTFVETPAAIWLTPAVPDRALVIYPEARLHVPSGESITLFCSVPLWMRVAAGENRIPLLETPIDRPPDTWFGPSTREGELCYATTTQARLERDAVPIRAHRATTELRIHNAAAAELQLERINLAVPFLSLFSTPDGRIWTESVALERASTGEMGRLRVADPPVEAEVEKIAGPRLAPETGGMLVRAFTALFD
jgi:hypothetical protein